MVVLTGILAACIAIIVLFEPISAVNIPGPDDSHAYKVAVANFPLTNPAQQDPHDPQSDRKLEVSLFMPVKKADCTGELIKLYMPASTARASDVQFFGNSSSGAVFEKMEYKACSGSRQITDASKYPIVFLESQVGVSRFLYSTLARFISANGMAVVLIDHPHESSTTQHAAGDTETPPNSSMTLDPFTPLQSWNSTITQAINTRILDINSVLQQLSDISLMQRQFPSLHINAPLATSSYTILGHGLGGTTATTLSATDARVRFSINLSGTAPLLAQPTTAPVVFFGRSGFRRDDDINWPVTWLQLHGKATEWDLRDAGLFDFSDLPWIVDLARVNERVRIGHVKGLKGLGPWGFHITACWLEAYVKMELEVPRERESMLGKCVGMFPQMRPYGWVNSTQG